MRLGVRAWRLSPHDPGTAARLARELKLAPLVARILAARGVSAPQDAQLFLNPRLDTLPRPAAMAGLDAAVGRLATAIRGRERVAVYGDYDADGVTAAALAVLVLRALGTEVRPWLANRFAGGYGLCPETVDEMSADGRSLVLVVDCGTSDLPALRRAQELGLDVVIVDHHPLSLEFPPVVALVNPHQPDCAFPDKTMASVGLVFYVMAALRSELKATLDMRSWLELVALGTVADVAPMGGINRVLVRRGLERLSCPSRPGLTALLTLAGATGPATAEVVGFKLGPRINAAGRLGSPDLALALLLEDDSREAERLAAQLDALSQERRAIQRDIVAAALPEAERQARENRPVLVVAGEGWHQGVIGIVAARLCDDFDRPAAVVGLEGEWGRGSARAPAGVNLHRVLCACAPYLERFGGHAAAAGFSLAVHQLAPFSEAMAQAVTEQLSESSEPSGLSIDVEAAAGDLTLGAVQDLERLGPFGVGNPEPVLFLRQARVARAEARAGGHLGLILEQQGVSLRAFGPAMAAEWPSEASVVDVAFFLRRNTYRGLDQVELRLFDVRPAVA